MALDNEHCLTISYVVGSADLYSPLGAPLREYLLTKDREHSWGKACSIADSSEMALRCQALSVARFAVCIFLLTRISEQREDYACNYQLDPSLRFMPFCNTSLSDDIRVRDLVARMTLQEKVTQLVNNAQSVSRLGIPAYSWWQEGLHGVAHVDFGGSLPPSHQLPASYIDNGVLQHDPLEPDRPGMCLNFNISFVLILGLGTVWEIIPEQATKTRSCQFPTNNLERQTCTRLFFQVSVLVLLGSCFCKSRGVRWISVQFGWTPASLPGSSYKSSKLASKESTRNLVKVDQPTQNRDLTLSVKARA